MILFLTVMVVFFCDRCANESYEWTRDKVEKPTILPDDAYYFGGIDGGHWIKFHSMRGDTCRFIVYEINGELKFDADFIVDAKEFAETLTKEIWPECNGCWDGRNLVIDLPNNREYAYTLTPLEPLYYNKYSRGDSYESLWYGDIDGELQY